MDPRPFPGREHPHSDRQPQPFPPGNFTVTEADRETQAGPRPAPGDEGPARASHERAASTSSSDCRSPTTAAPEGELHSPERREHLLRAGRVLPQRRPWGERRRRGR